MADLSDVEVALVELALATLYPLGLDKACVIGAPVRVYRGWPIAASLEADLTAGVANLSVFSMPGSGRNTTRWGSVVHATPTARTLNVQCSGSSATFGGVGGVGQVAGLLADGQPFVYRGNEGDTAALVAAVLAESVRLIRPCWLSGVTLTIPGCTALIGRVVSDATTTTEWARQEQGFRISAWCPNPVARDVLCSTMTSSLASTPFLTLADGSAGRLRYRSMSSDDNQQDSHQYRRDLIYDVEYGTSLQVNSPVMLFGGLNWTGQSIYA